MFSKIIHMFYIAAVIAEYPSGFYNRLTENAPNVGTFHGTCTCPDGSEYTVGDNVNQCASLACYGGVAGQCYKSNVDPALPQGLMVECNVTAPSPPPSPPPPSPPPPSPPPYPPSSPSPLAPGHDYVEMFTSDITTSFNITDPVDPSPEPEDNYTETRRLSETTSMSPTVFEYAMYTAFDVIYNIPRFHPDCGLIESDSNKCIQVMHNEGNTSAEVKVYVSPNMNPGFSSIAAELAMEDATEPFEAIIDIFNRIIIGQYEGTAFVDLINISSAVVLYSALTSFNDTVFIDDYNTTEFNCNCSCTKDVYVNDYDLNSTDGCDLWIEFLNPVSSTIVNMPAKDDDDDDLTTGDIVGIVIASGIGFFIICMIAFAAWPKNARICVRRDPDVISTTPTPGLETVSPPTERELAVAEQSTIELAVTEP